MNRGQIQLGVAIVSAIGVILASIGGSWMSGGRAAERELAGVNTEVQVVKTTQDLQYKEVIKALERLEKKIDMIAPATVPAAKAETFSTKSEQVKKAPLIIDITKNGLPRNEHD